MTHRPGRVGYAGAMRTPLALLLVALPAAARADEALDKAAALHRAGRPFEALAALDAAPPATAKLTRWAVAGQPHLALVGRKHVVITTHASRGARRSRWPAT